MMNLTELWTAYGHNKTEFPDNYEGMLEVAKASNDAVFEPGYGTEYTFGSAASMLCESEITWLDSK